MRLTGTRRLTMTDPQNYLVRSQDLEETYHDAGQFYWGTADAFLKGRPILGEGAVPVELPRHRVQDIDTPEDWLRAEAMYNALLEMERRDADRLPS
jgi:pseudaminic acid cytidylyltransferase